MERTDTMQRYANEEAVKAAHWSQFQEALRKGNLEIVERMLFLLPYIRNRVPSPGRDSPLFDLLEGCDQKTHFARCFALLLRYGANVNAAWTEPVRYDTVTPLSYALSQTETSSWAVELLLKRGASVFHSSVLGALEDARKRLILPECRGLLKAINAVLRARREPRLQPCHWRNQWPLPALTAMEADHPPLMHIASVEVLPGIPLYPDFPERIKIWWCDIHTHEATPHDIVDHNYNACRTTYSHTILTMPLGKHIALSVLTGRASAGEERNKLVWLLGPNFIDRAPLGRFLEAIDRCRRERGPVRLIDSALEAFFEAHIELSAEELNRGVTITFGGGSR